MEVRYQRDLYRVQLCCDTEKDEEKLGYPLQMCLRNTIRGLLACQVQGTDNRLTVCWDVTSRHSLAQVTGEGQISPDILQRILRALSQTMEAMARYLLPCEYLVLDPALLFLTPESGEVGFVCDFEDAQSFQRTLLMLGEYVLEHMDHREQKAMHLGYGLYRLAVEESFDKEALRRLCSDMPLPEKEAPESQGMDWKEGNAAAVQKMEINADRAYGERPPAGRENPGRAQKVLHRQERDMAVQQKQDALEAFFAEDEEERKLQLHPWQMCGGCAAAVLLGTGIMEGVQLIRNGRHLQPVWLLVAAILFLLSTAATLLLWYLSGKKKSGETAEKEKSTYSMENRGVPVCNRNQREPQQRYTTEKGQRGNIPAGVYAGQAYPTPKRPVEEPVYERMPQSMETVVLNRRMPETVQAQLRFADGRVIPLRGRQWLIGKSPADTDICLAQPTVSRIHARIWKKEDAYYIEDLHSRNGTMVGESLLEPGEKRRLEAGTQLSFAEHLCTFTTEQETYEMKCRYNV